MAPRSICELQVTLCVTPSGTVLEEIKYGRVTVSSGPVSSNLTQRLSDLDRCAVLDQERDRIQ